MAAMFIDLDGTCLKYHTNEWLPGVWDYLIEMAKNNTIIFVTMRAHGRDDNEIWNATATQKLIDTLPFNKMLILGVPWPRIIIDDFPPLAIHTAQDSADWVEHNPTNLTVQ